MPERSAHLVALVVGLAGFVVLFAAAVVLDRARHRFLSVALVALACAPLGVVMASSTRLAGLPPLPFWLAALLGGLVYLVGLPAARRLFRHPR